MHEGSLCLHPVLTPALPRLTPVLKAGFVAHVYPGFGTRGAGLRLPLLKATVDSPVGVTVCFEPTARSHCCDVACAPGPLFRCACEPFLGSCCRNSAAPGAPDHTAWAFQDGIDGLQATGPKLSSVYWEQPGAEQVVCSWWGGSQAASAEASVISQTPSQGVQGPGACVILGLAVVLKCGHSSLGRRFQSLLSVGRGEAPGPFLHLELL